MNRIQILDCTLRDGGYCNQWRFGRENTKKVIAALDEATIDLIECGFLTGPTTYNEDTTKFTDLNQLEGLLPDKRRGRKCVCMVNYGEYDLDTLPVCNGKTIDGIRLAFHKKDRKAAMLYGQKIMEKGYRLFLQPMVTKSYTDWEFLSLIEDSNAIKPYAFYIVDSFGAMGKNDLTRFAYIVENNLHSDILMGFHGHNNMQLAFSNAQVLVGMSLQHQLIIDSSIYGMGRGAGNLNSELLAEFLNDNTHANYKLRPLLRVIDEVLEEISKREHWGYSLANYLSASHGCHPNYAYYLNNKKTLTYENMDEIFSMVAEEKKDTYDKAYIEELYLSFMENGRKDGSGITTIGKVFEGKTVLLIAPGQSAETEKTRIIDFASAHDVVTVSVNFDYSGLETDFIFVSNLRRFKALDSSKYGKMIVTSNIPCDDAFLYVDYKHLLTPEEAVSDNAGLMALNFFARQGVKEIYIAGMDGYSHESEKNYATPELVISMRKPLMDEINRGMEKVILTLSKSVRIHFLTSPKNIRVPLPD